MANENKAVCSTTTLKEYHEGVCLA